MRIRVQDVLELFVVGLDRREVLDELPDLEEEDLTACLKYASKKIDHPTVAA